MDKGVPPSLFVNDGSFMERFKQLQQETEKAVTAEDSSKKTDVTKSSTPTHSSVKTGTENKQKEKQKTAITASGSKLAFSLKQKSKLVIPAVKLGEEDDEIDKDIRNATDRVSAKRQRLGQPDISELPSRKVDVGNVCLRQYLSFLEMQFLLSLYQYMLKKTRERELGCPSDDVTLPLHAYLSIFYSARTPPSPSDPAVKKAADRLASFAAKNGRHIEDITRQKNPGDTPFKFLFDPDCIEYKYYEYRFQEEEKALTQTKDRYNGRTVIHGSEFGPTIPEPGSSYLNRGRSRPRPVRSTNSVSRELRLPVPWHALPEMELVWWGYWLNVKGETKGREEGDKSESASSVSRRLNNPQLNYHTPASALFEANGASSNDTLSARSRSGEAGSLVSEADPITMMEYYAKKAAAEERRRAPKQSHDEMPPPASLQGSEKRGHHMGDYIPLEELESFMAKCNDAAAQKAAKEAADKAKIQADNVGHKLLSKMGWREGEGLGSSRKGIADPITAGNVKKDNLGVGAQQPGEVTPDDDIYEQYKKRMMLGYRHRPNPLEVPLICRRHAVTFDTRSNIIDEVTVAETGDVSGDFSGADFHEEEEADFKVL
ncbi:hypothetical protein KSS87_001688 [Heliosperma pusillum]|nr:hypothetical protein KSS87_001688 [Heliosperma pusillum]